MSCRKQPYEDKSEVNCCFAAFILDLLNYGDLKKFCNRRTQTHFDKKISLRISLSFTYDYDKHSKQKELPFQLFPLIILNVTDAFAWFVLITKEAIVSLVYPPNNS